MTDSDLDSPINDEDDADVVNDEVIGAAFRTSLIVLMLMGIPVIGVLLYLNWSKTPAAAVESEVALPTVRQTDLESIPSIPLAPVAADQTGIDFVHQAGKNGDKLLPETMGSGLAIADFNSDGKLDVFFANSKRWPWDEGESGNGSGEEDRARDTCRLYFGDGELHFTDHTVAAGLDVPIYAMGAAAADFDNDGDVDLFVSAVGKNRLYQNEGGTFTDITSDAGVGGEDTAWSTSCGFLDYDNDGRLDLYVCNYVDWNKQTDESQNFTLDGETRAYGPPRAFAGTFSYLYHNEGDGKFSDVSELSGVQVTNADTGGPLGKSMGLAPLDFNNDGWMDLMVANDTVQNFLFENNRDGTFREVGGLLGVAFDRATGNARGAMGIDSVRFRVDGTLAIGIGNFANEASALYMARPGRQQFIDAAMHTGFGPPSRAALTFGLFFWDADLDGRPDVLGANGHLEEEIAATQSSQSYAQPPQVFWNAGRESTSELVMVAASCVGDGFCDPIVGRGAAYGDFDGDGDQDVIITVNDAAPRVFRNDQSTDHHFLRVDVRGTRANRDGMGAVVTVESGESSWSAMVMPTKSYLSQCEKTLTFGLGDRDSVDRVTIQWPSAEGETNSQQVVLDPPVDQTLTVVEAVGTRPNDEGS